MAFALGSFVDGLFSGAKSTMDLIDTKRKMDDAQAVRDSVEAARVQANADVEAQSSAKTFTAALGNYGGGTGDTGTTGSSTPPVPTEIKEGVTGTRSPTARNAGAPELVDRIAPLVSKRESSDNPYAGYTPPNQPVTDLSKAPARPGFFGFPEWTGNVNPETGQRSHAAGLFGFEPDTWKQYAGPLGVTDFSPESQRKVFNAAYLDQGMRPWASNRALMGDVAAAGLLGGAATSAARVGTGQPSALNAPGQAPVQSPGSVAPDLEGQRAKAQPVPTNTASTVLRTILSGGTTPAQQANVPEGYAQAPQLPTAPPVSPSPRLTPSATAADPFAVVAATSALSPTPSASSPSSPAPVTVTPTPQRPVLSELRRSDYQVSGRSEPPGYGQGSGYMGRQTPIGGMPPQRSIRPDEKIIRLPDGTMVDGSGNVVRQAPSALFPR